MSKANEYSGLSEEAKRSKLIKKVKKFSTGLRHSKSNIY